MSTVAHRIDRVSTGSLALQTLLLRHPAVQEVGVDGPIDGIVFWTGAWRRQVHVGHASVFLAGLVELMDNNPLVCADEMSVPDAATTLLMIAIGPLIEAGLLLEAPVALTNSEYDAALSEAFLHKMHWDGGVLMEREEIPDLGAIALNSFAKIRTPNDLGDIDALYEERFGRSFYVRRDETSDWDVRLTKDLPHAVYRLRITPGDEESLLTIQTMADADGKCGAAQVVHAMNVMAGLEETLGISV